MTCTGCNGELRKHSKLELYRCPDDECSEYDRWKLLNNERLGSRTERTDPSAVLPLVSLTER